MKTNYHVYNQSFLTPLLQGFSKSGANINTTASKSLIKKIDFEREGAYIPMSILYEFLINLSEDHDVNNLANEFYMQMNFDELGEYGEFISQCNDMLTVILEGIKYESIFQTNTRMNLEVKGPMTRFSQMHIDPNSKGREFAEDIAFIMALKGFKMVLGKDWNPKILHVPRTSVNWIDRLIDVRKVNITYSNPYYAWDFDSKWLYSKNHTTSKGVAAPLISNSTTSERIIKILDSFKTGYFPTLVDFSDFFNVSQRTVVRSLQQEGLKYSALLERSLFKKSLEMINDESISINEISDSIGYANAQNFIRAFKKWTNTTPNEYRKLLIA